MNWNKIKWAVGQTKQDVRRVTRIPMFRDIMHAIVFSVVTTAFIVAFVYGMVNYTIITMTVSVALTIFIGLGKLTLMTFRHYRNIRMDDFDA